MNQQVRRTIVAVAAVLLSQVAVSAPVTGQGSWETTLQPRDLNGDSVADAYYDTDLNVTWLRDANYAKSSGYDADGIMSWSDAMTWATSLNYYGVTGWTLPTTVNSASSGAFAPSPSSSQMAHMYFSTLGNPTNQVTNTAYFDNLQLSSYWSSTPATEVYVWRFSFETVLPGQAGCLRCRQSIVGHGGGDSGLYAWAVHAGDVTSPVPEPSALALATVGLLGVTFSRHARRLRKTTVKTTAAGTRRVP